MVLLGDNTLYILSFVSTERGVMLEHDANCTCMIDELGDIKTLMILACAGIGYQ